MLGGKIMPNKNKNLKIGIVVGAIVVALIVLVVVLFGVSTNNSKDKTYTFNDARKATNRYAHFLIDGEKNDQSDIDKIDEESKTYLERVLQDDTEKKVRQDFLKTAKELGDDMLLKISHLKSDDNFKNVDQFIDKAGDVAAETNMLAGYYDTDYSVEAFVKYYNDKDGRGVNQYLEDKLKDLEMYYTLSIEGAEGLEDETSEDEDEDVDEEADREDDETISNRDVLSKTELLLADFYDYNMAYTENVIEILNGYEEFGCLKSNEIDKDCKKKFDEGENGPALNTALKENLNKIKSIIKGADTDLSYNVQWLAVNFKDQKQ